MKQSSGDSKTGNKQPLIFPPQRRKGEGLILYARQSHYTKAMSLTLFVASTNAGKLRDFRTAAESDGIAIEPLPGLKSIEAPEENGVSFAENAAIKALYYSRLAPGKLVLADDSGLEVDGLEGEPGVRSARFASDAGLEAISESESSDERNNRLLIERIKRVPREKRQARYRCVLVAALDGEVVAEASGAVEGEILEQLKGTGGFGYDPLFWLPEFGATMAEIPLEQKHGFSHRGRALRALLGLLPR